MNPERMTVLSMRQREMVYYHEQDDAAVPTMALSAPPPVAATAMAAAAYYHPPQQLHQATTTTSHVVAPIATYVHPHPLQGAGGSGYPVMLPPPPVQSPVVRASRAEFYGPGSLVMGDAGSKLDGPRMCYSPLSVGQLPTTGGSYDQFGFIWYWITDVCAHFSLQRQTAHFAIQYAQRILRQRLIGLDDHGFSIRHYEDLTTLQKDLQVLGLVCVFIAAKIEEVHPPKAADFADFMSDHGAVTCTADDIVRLESEYLVELKWNLHPTTVFSWLQFLLAGEASEQPLETMGDFVNPHRAPSVRKDVFVAANYIIDAALLEYQSMDFLPSVLAGSAILLADPGLDVVYVARFLQLDPNLLWECKNWLVGVTNGLSDVEPEGSRDGDRWAKVPNEELLFVQARVPVPSHLAYGLLRSEQSTFRYSSCQYEQNGYNGYQPYSTMNCASPASCDTYGCYCADSFRPQDTSAPNVYHYKYGWQGTDLGYNPPTVQRKLHFS